MENPEQKKTPDYSNITAGQFGFKGLSNAHKLGMSWGQIIAFVAVIVGIFVIYTFVMSKASMNKSNQIQNQVDEQTRQAEEQSKQMQAQIEAQIQQKIKEAQENK